MRLPLVCTKGHRWTMLTSMSFRFSLAALALNAALFAQTIPPMPESVIHDADIEYSNVGGRVAMDIVRPRASASEPRPRL